MCGVSAAALLSLRPAVALAWPTADCLASSFHVHGDIAAHVVDHPSIAPLLAPLGLTRDGIIAAAKTEPTCSMDHHPGWSELASQSHLAWPVSDATVGAILHVGGDAGVPCNHCPGCEVFVDTSVGQPAESVLEGAAELASVPALTATYGGTYDEQMAAFHADEVALATTYKAFWEDGSHFCPLCNTTPYATTGMANGQKLAYAALLLYLTTHAPPPSDAGQADSSGPADDAGAADAGPDSSGPSDGGTAPDAGGPDGGGEAVDAPANDAPTADAAGGGNGSGGCGCGAAGPVRGTWAVLLLVVAAPTRRRWSSSNRARRGRREALRATLAAALAASLVVSVASCGARNTMEFADARLRKRLLEHHIPENEIVLPFAADDGIRTFARSLPRAGGTLERGRAVAQAVRQLLDDSQTRRWRWLRLPDRRPRTAGELLAALRGRSAGDVQSYEVAALTLATARAAGLHAVMAEVQRQGGRVADPTGVVGAYAVAILDRAPAPEVRLSGYVDAFGEGPVEDAQLQDDPTAVAGYYVLKALAHAGGDGDVDAAARAASLAGRLAPDSPLPLGAKGQALLAAGRTGEALVELRDAVLKQDDAPRQTNLATALLAARELDLAEGGIRLALERDGAFARTHQSLAVVLAMKGDAKGAAAALAAAERLDPKLPGLRLARAHVVMASGDVAGAERECRAELGADPGNELAGLVLHGLLRSQKRFAEADLVRDELLKRTRNEARLSHIFDTTTGGGP